MTAACLFRCFQGDTGAALGDSMEPTGGGKGERLQTTGIR